MEKEKVLLQATLCFAVRPGRVLLAEKVGKIGAGCLNGYGGGIEAGESPEEAALRELLEESGLRGDPRALRKAAVVDFHNITSEGKEFTCQVHTYLLSDWSGDPIETDQMRSPAWYSFANLPVQRMMLADRFWLPRMLGGEKLYAQAWYGPRQQTLLRPVQIGPFREYL